MSQESKVHTTPGDEERKRTIKANGIDALRRIHGDHTWEDWLTIGEALTVITEEASAVVDAPAWDPDNKRLVKEFNRRWEAYESGAGTNYKPLSKQERSALRFVMTHPEVGAFRASLDGPLKRRHNHPNAVINKWRADARRKEPAPRQAQTSAASAALVRELAAAKARIAELAAEIARLRAPASRAAEPIKHDDATGKAADGRAYKLLRMLDSSNENEVLKAAQALAASYDLRALGTALDDAHTKQQKKPPPPPPIDWPKVEAAITRYVEGKTKVTVSHVRKAIIRAMPEFANRLFHQYIAGTLRRLGFTPSSQSGEKTFSRPTPATSP